MDIQLTRRRASLEALMHITTDDFYYSTVAEPHRERTKAILKQAPHIRQYMRKNPYTVFLIMAVVVLQFALARLMSTQPWWFILVVAFGVGAFATHALAMMIHECAHNLLFKKNVGNYLAGILANVPMVVPSAISFRRYHLKHHAFQGIYELDADIPSRWEAALIGHSPIGKILWLLFLPFFYMTRPLRIREVTLLDRWTVLNIVVVVLCDLAVCLLLGPKAFVYLLVSLFFSIGLHPIGGRWIQEHYLVAPPQETYSYYGPLNRLALNVGYHNEHHDFPSVPWNHLPKVKAAAPQWYDTLVSHMSWAALVYRFIFDPQLSLYSRMLRRERGGVPMGEFVPPDAALAQGAESGR